MLTFFRKIRLRLLGLASADTVRKSMVESSSFKKYFLYAIGEIALVVIGILIALQINNWNTQVQNNKTETEYLKRLISDISVDRDLLSFTDSLAQVKEYAIQGVMEFYQSETTVVTDTLMRYLNTSRVFSLSLPQER